MMEPIYRSLSEVKYIEIVPESECIFVYDREKKVNIHLNTKELTRLMEAVTKELYKEEQE